MKYIKTFESHSSKPSIDKELEKLRDKVRDWEEKSANGANNIEPESVKDEWVAKISKLQTPVNEHFNFRGFWHVPEPINLNLSKG